VKRRYIILPLFIFFSLYLLSLTSNVDMGLEKVFYSPSRGFFLRYSQPWLFLYKYGVIPSIALSIGGAIVFLLSFRVRRLKTHRRAALYLVMVMLIGPGLLVNLILKEHWGRPRPRQIKEFGGNERYVPPGKMGPGGHSFPSGHASAAFYLITPFFILRKRNRKLALSSLLFGLCYGSLMGIGRMIQGAHFFSDILFSAAIVYFTALGLAYLFGLW